MRLGVLDVALHAHVDAAEAVDDPREPAEADLDVAVDGQAGGALQGRGEQLRPAEGEGGVDLVLPLPRDREVAVPRHRDEHRLAGAARGVDEDDRVRAPATGIAADTERLALRRAEALAAVRAHEQVGVPVGVGRPVARGGGVLAAHLRPRVDRRDDDEHGPREQRHEDDPQHPPAPARPGRARCPRGCGGRLPAATDGSAQPVVRRRGGCRRRGWRARRASSAGASGVDDVDVVVVGRAGARPLRDRPGVVVVHRRLEGFLGRGRRPPSVPRKSGQPLTADLADVGAPRS